MEVVHGEELGLRDILKSKGKACFRREVEKRRPWVAATIG